MEQFFSISTLVASAVGAVVSIAMFVLLPKLKASAGGRSTTLLITGAVAGVVLVSSIASLRSLNEGTKAPGNVVVDVPPPSPSSASRPIPLPPVASAPTLPSPVAISPSLAPKRITVTESFSVTQAASNDLFRKSTKPYVRVFEAKPGFRIVEAKFVERSATRVGNFSLVSDGDKATVRFTLTSGSGVDRYRGWLHGDIVMTQERISP